MQNQVTVVLLLQHPCSVLQRLREVVDLDIECKIRTLAVLGPVCWAQNCMECFLLLSVFYSLHLAHGGAHEDLGENAQATEFVDLRRAHVGIAVQPECLTSICQT